MGLQLSLTDAQSGTSNSGLVDGTVKLYITDGGSGGVGDGAVYIERADKNGAFKRYPELTYTVETAQEVALEYGAKVRVAAEGCDGVDVELVQ